MSKEKKETETAWKAKSDGWKCQIERRAGR